MWFAFLQLKLNQKSHLVPYRQNDIYAFVSLWHKKPVCFAHLQKGVFILEWLTMHVLHLLS